MNNIENLKKMEIDILRNAVDNAEKKIGKDLIQNPKIGKIIKILENFISKKKLLCYGGTAINNILPYDDQFYDKSYQLPDYDFFSNNAINDAKELSDIYYKNGFFDVECKAGIHVGTYKVYVNFIPIADITHLEDNIFNILKKEEIIKNNIAYVPANFLKMSCYLELSRPAGDISRWEKILKRLILLNKHYRITIDKLLIQTKKINIDKNIINIDKNIINIGKNNGDVFFGKYAIFLYSKYISINEKEYFNIFPYYNFLCLNAKKSCNKFKQMLKKLNYKNIKSIKKSNIGELIPTYYELYIDNKLTILFYESDACYSYNINNDIKIATIDTMLRFFYAFLYTNIFNLDNNYILSICENLYKIQIRNRFKQIGILKRFSTTCQGRQETLESIREKKSLKYKQLKNKKKSYEYEKHFLRYFPKNKTLKNK